MEKTHKKKYNSKYIPNGLKVGLKKDMADSGRV